MGPLRSEAVRLAAVPLPTLPAVPGDGRLGDPRFRRLLGTDAWNRLPSAVRARFAHRLADGRTVVYRGRVTAMRANRVGRWLAQALRLVGAPLPLARDTGVASVISVTEDAAAYNGQGGGQNWTRLYANRTGFPQIIHSAKRFTGPTGLEEHLGRACGVGLVMMLDVGEESGALVFRDRGYALEFGLRRLRLPRWLEPGRLAVRHEDRGHGRFLFALTLDHPWAGELIHQEGLYEDVPEEAGR